MSKRLWLKGALFVLASGTTLGLGLGGGCLSNVVQRILVAVAFD
jgi:hypothetical protein